MLERYYLHALFAPAAAFYAAKPPPRFRTDVLSRRPSRPCDRISGALTNEAFGSVYGWSPSLASRSKAPSPTLGGRRRAKRG